MSGVLPLASAASSAASGSAVSAAASPAAAAIAASPHGCGAVYLVRSAALSPRTWLGLGLGLGVGVGVGLGRGGRFSAHLNVG